MLGTAVGLCAVIGLGSCRRADPAPDLIFKRKPPAIAVMIVDADRDPQGASMAASVTDRLADGLAGIDNIRVAAPRSEKRPAVHGRRPARSTGADWRDRRRVAARHERLDLEARMTDTATGEVKWTGSLPVGEIENRLFRSTVAAGCRHRMNLPSGSTRSSIPMPKPRVQARQAAAKVVVQQAIARINQTTRERFAASQTMLESASLAGAPDNVDLAGRAGGVADTGSRWSGTVRTAARRRAAPGHCWSAPRYRPNYIPGLEAAAVAS